MAMQTGQTHEAQEAINRLKSYLMESEIRILFPVSPDTEFTFTLTRKVTRQQFKRIIDTIKLAEDSCCIDEQQSK